jgi:Flp pilus assembly protein TadG
MGRTTTNLRRRRTGAAVVEMAVVVPVLLLLALGCTDFGRVFHAYSVVSSASRCGAEYGSLHNFSDSTRAAWEAAIVAAVEREMEGLSGYQASQLQTDVSTTVDTDGLFIAEVEVSYPFQTAVAWPGLPSSVSLSHRVAMRRIH